MDLIFEVLNVSPSVRKECCQKAFKQAGGVIGRGQDCEWIIPDTTRHLSKHHALVSYHEGAYYLTDTSSNGTWNTQHGTRLDKGEAMRIEHGSVYVLGDFEMRARLVGAPATLDETVSDAQAVGSDIPDDAFLDVAALSALYQQARKRTTVGERIAPSAAPEAPGQHADGMGAECQREAFWTDFAAALGVNLTDLDQVGREHLALTSARLLHQSIGGLQQSLRTCSALKNELRLPQPTAQGRLQNPLKYAGDASDALSMLLQPQAPAQLSAEQALGGAFHDLQTHQMALLTASRAAMHGTLKHFSPEELILHFERDSTWFPATSGSHWKAYGRYHQTLRQDDGWSERLLARYFAQAYEEQVRLISSLYNDNQG